MGIKYIVIFFFLIILSPLSAQPNNVKIYQNGNLEYYLHSVQKNQTIYQLSKLYKIDIEDIFANNPGSERGISVHDTLIIPVVRETIVHVIEPQQTLYSIAKFYRVDLDEVLKNNPGSETNIRIGQRLLIKNGIKPINISVDDAPEITNGSDSILITKENIKLNDSILKYYINKKESIYSISKRYKTSIDAILNLNNLNSRELKPGQAILIPIKNEVENYSSLNEYPQIESDSITPWSFDTLENSHIVFCLPLGLSNQKKYKKYINQFTGFYMGSKLAIDTLDKLGLNAQVHYIDYLNANIPLMNTINEINNEHIDILFAPLDSSYFETLNNWAMANNTMIIFPSKGDIKLIEKNRNALLYRTLEESLIERLGIECAKSKQKTILIRTNDVSTNYLEEIFIKSFNNYLEPDDYSLIIGNQSNYKFFKNSNDTVNLVFLSGNEKNVEAFLKENSEQDEKNENKFRTNSNVQIYGRECWLNFENITQDINNQFTFYTTSYDDYNYWNEKIIDLNRLFRNTYQCDLDKASCFGYDLTFNTLNLLLFNGYINNGKMNDLKLFKRYEEYGFENIHSFNLKFDNFNTIRLE